MYKCNIGNEKTNKTVENNKWIYKCKICYVYNTKNGKILPAYITSKLLEESILKLNSHFLLLDGFPRNSDNLYVLIVYLITWIVLA